jgi:hypothetical protein
LKGKMPDVWVNLSAVLIWRFLSRCKIKSCRRAWRRNSESFTSREVLMLGVVKIMQR